MNIFVVDKDPFKAAVHLHDKHVVKMILESAQMLSTCRQYYGDKSEVMLKACFHNHPCNVWLRESHSNYDWLVRHMSGLLKEYTYRYFKIHRYENLMIRVFATPLKGLDNKGITPFALAMPDEFKVEDPVQSYRNYYLGRKIENKTWTNRKREHLDIWLSSKLDETRFKLHPKLQNNHSHE